MSENGSAAASVPDVFGRTGRARAIASLLGQIQGQVFALDVEQVVNDLADDANAPGYEDRTVAEERDRLREQEARIRDNYGELMEDVERLLPTR